MQNYFLQTPVGVKDYTYKLMEKKEKLQAQMKNLYVSNGYHLIETPTFEFLDVFKIGQNDIQTPELYKLINRYGEILALKSDMTKSIARVVSSETKGLKSPQRLCYITNSFRYPKEYLGKLHEFTQAGIELVGSSNVYADYEILSLAIKSLNISLKNDYTIHLSSSDFFINYFNEIKIDDSLQNSIFEAIEEKNMVKIKKALKTVNLSAEAINTILLLTESVGKLELIKKVKQNVKNEDTLKSINRLEEIYKLLEIAHLEKNVYFDFSLLSYGNYYTGIYFQAYTSNVGSVILEGGRYDNLLNEFNNDKPSVGFAMNINDILNKIIDDEENNLIMVFSESKEKTIKYLLNKEGFMSLFDTLGESLEYGLEYGIKKIYDLDKNNTYQLEKGGYILCK